MGDWPRRKIFMTIGCFLADLIFMGVQGQPVIFPTLSNYHALLWFSQSRALKAFGACGVLVLAHIYGYLVYRELFFVVGVALSAFLLKRVLKESLPVVFSFTCLFYLIHACLMELSVTWTGAVFFGNIIIIYSILKYQDVR